MYIDTTYAPMSSSSNGNLSPSKSNVEGEVIGSNPIACVITNNCFFFFFLKDTTYAAILVQAQFNEDCISMKEHTASYLD